MKREWKERHKKRRRRKKKKKRIRAERGIRADSRLENKMRKKREED